MKTLTEQFTSAKRELAYRRHAYPKWVLAHKMSQQIADHELACMEAICKTLEKMVMLEQVGEEMKQQELKV